jgi:hypothetical protein
MTERWFPLEFDQAEQEKLLDKASIDIRAYIATGKQSVKLVLDFPRLMTTSLLKDFLSELELYLQRCKPAKGYICGGNLWGNRSADVTLLNKETIIRMQTNPDFGRRLRIEWD